MDELRSKAVTEAFVRLYKDGLIYRLVFSLKVLLLCGILILHQHCACIYVTNFELSHLCSIYLLDGLLFCRAHRLVNWDCTLRTAISDIEVDKASTLTIQWTVWLLALLISIQYYVSV